MSISSFMTLDERGLEIDFKKIQDIIFWSKKWEISPNRLVEASQTLNSNNVKSIENYLREKGFAL
ncbi:MAG: hypothetical protein ABIN89_13165 [Chitinophagaceae bacterium]